MAYKEIFKYYNVKYHTTKEALSENEDYPESFRLKMSKQLSATAKNVSIEILGPFEDSVQCSTRQARLGLIKFVTSAGKKLEETGEETVDKETEDDDEEVMAAGDENIQKKSFTVSFSLRDEEIWGKAATADILIDERTLKTTSTDYLKEVLNKAGLVRHGMASFNTMLSVMKDEGVTDENFTDLELPYLYFFEVLSTAVESGFANGNGKLFASELCRLFYGGHVCFGQTYCASSEDFGFNFKLETNKSDRKRKRKYSSSSPAFMSYSSDGSSIGTERNRNKNFRYTDALHVVRQQFRTYVPRVVIEIKNDDKDRDIGITQAVSFAFGIMERKPNISKLLLVVIDPFNWYMAKMTRGQKEIKTTRYMVSRSAFPEAPVFSVRNLLSFLKDFETFEEKEFT